MTPWSGYDAWEARDRTLLEAADARRRRLELLMGFDEIDENSATLELERVYAGQLSLAPADGYDPESPDEDGPR